MTAAASAKPIQVSVLSASSPLLAAVVALGDRNAQHVGLFPRSCFEREADRKRILVATRSDDSLAGYLLYRVARNRAVIQQLCVDDEARGAGVARLLFETLKASTRHLDGIALHCARDFPAHGLWPKLGFVPHGEKPGRGEIVRTLTRFWYDHGHSGLFSTIKDDRLTVVMDANVAYSVQDDDPECIALTQDWLAEEVELCITSELYHEIDRHADGANRERRRGFAHCMRQIEATDEATGQVFAELERVLNHPQSRSGRSDLRHLAIAIAGKARVFITRDSGVLGHAKTVENQFGLRVVRPAELIAGIDEQHRADTYAPSQLGGSEIKVRRIAGADLAMVAERFLATASGERRIAFEHALGELCAHPRHVDPLIFEHPAGNPVAVCVIDFRSPGAATIPIYRVRPGPLATTMLYFLATHMVRAASDHRCTLASVQERTPLVPIDAALAALGFSQGPGSWTRRIESGIHDFAGHPCIDPWDERRRWPAKLVGAGIKSFITPIRPHWVRELVGAPAHDLFGGDPRLILSPESVYFRSAQPAVLSAPGRILWYESRGTGRGADGRQAVVGCSSLLGIEVGAAKEIFRRFRRLGVLEWRQVKEIADKNPDGNVMAVRYGLTEHFIHPPKRRRVEATLERHLGHGHPLVTTVEIPEPCFEELYRTGMGLASKD